MLDVETDVINKMRSIESCRTSGSFQFLTADGRSQGELLDFVHGNEAEPRVIIFVRISPCATEYC